MNVLVKPIITEKFTAISEADNKFAFVVHKDANKIQIRNAVSKMYNVSVEEVKTMNMPAKSKSRYTKSGFVSGRKSGFKRAIVSLAKGDTIDFYSNI